MHEPSIRISSDRGRGFCSQIRQLSHAQQNGKPDSGEPRSANGLAGGKQWVALPFSLSGAVSSPGSSPCPSHEGLRWGGRWWVMVKKDITKAMRWTLVLAQGRCPGRKGQVSAAWVSPGSTLGFPECWCLDEPQLDHPARGGGCGSRKWASRGLLPEEMPTQASG